jgi:hypothetical protein
VGCGVCCVVATVGVVSALGRQNAVMKSYLSMTDAWLCSTVVPKLGTLRRPSLMNLDAEVEWTAAL